jgi:hypothetical protein
VYSVAKEIRVSPDQEEKVLALFKDEDLTLTEAKAVKLYSDCQYLIRNISI